MSPNGSIDVFGNMRRIDNRKADILVGVGNLYKILSTGNEASDEEISECIAEIMAASISLGDCLGIGYAEIEKKIIKKLRLQMAE